jgi:hypothetical protein
MTIAIGCFKLPIWKLRKGVAFQVSAIRFYPGRRCPAKAVLKSPQSKRSATAGKALQISRSAWTAAVDRRSRTPELDRKQLILKVGIPIFFFAIPS